MIHTHTQKHKAYSSIIVKPEILAHFKLTKITTAQKSAKPTHVAYISRMNSLLLASVLELSATVELELLGVTTLNGHRKLFASGA